MCVCVGDMDCRDDVCDDCDEDTLSRMDLQDNRCKVVRLSSYIKTYGNTHTQ